jgi:tRNA pseudouridine55 synthase
VPPPAGAAVLPPGGSPAPSPVIPLADAAAAAFPRLDLTSDDARRLAQGARLPLPEDSRPEAPLAAFAPDGSLVALVTAADGRLRSLAVFS